MHNWLLSKITDYWDSKRDSIEKYASEITTASPEVRANSLDAIRKAIAEHVRVLPERTLLDVLWIVADDLFKAGNSVSGEGGGFDSYLEASAGTLFALARKRKCILHYLVDNVYEQTEFGMRRPLELYENWFRSAGLVYICPQRLAISLMNHDKHDSKQNFKLLPKYINEAIDLARLSVEKCHTDARHYVFLNADSSDKPFSFECCLKIAGSPGIVTALRTEAPIVGSKVSITYPENAK
jgi:hypothetical protein